LIDRSDAAIEADLATLSKAGIRVIRAGDGVICFYPWRVQAIGLGFMGLFWLWVAAELGGVLAGWPGQGQMLDQVLTYFAERIPHIGEGVYWLKLWYPWPSLVIAATSITLFWSLLIGRIRRLEMRPDRVKVVKGMRNIGREHPITPEVVISARDGRVRMASFITLSPTLKAPTAAHLARLMAQVTGGSLDLPPGQR
jgi:hypothetical protein